jgi:hypothetical protein
LFGGGSHRCVVDLAQLGLKVADCF